MNELIKNEIDEYFDLYGNFSNFNGVEFRDLDSLIGFAKHFYKLGLKFNED